MSRRTHALAALALASACALATRDARAQENCPMGALYPGAEWPDRTAEVRAAKPDEVRRLDEIAFTLTPERDEMRLGERTDALIVIHQGAIFYERYARGWGATNPHFGWSMSKSVTNALTGIAVRENALSLDSNICDVLQMSLPTESHCRVTVRALLEFSSGFDWAEEYEGRGNQASSVLAMLYGQGHFDMASFVAHHVMRDEPGATFMYSSGDTTLLAGLVERRMTPRFGSDYPWTTLFDRLGVSTATFERDVAGTPVGSSFVFATPRDWARLGYFWLNDGCWQGARVLPEGWMRDSSSVNAPIRLRSVAREDGDVQGRCFWLNRLVPEAGQTTLPWPDVPDDAYAARGHWGQSVTMIPSLDLVVVRMGDDRNDRDPNFFNNMLAQAIRVVR